MSRTLLVAGGLAVVGLAAVSRGWEHKEPPKYRVFGGPEAIWNIPDGRSMGSSAPVRLRIPTAGVNARIGEIGENADGGIAVPAAAKAREAAWFRSSPTPGTRGSSIIVGHYDDDKGGAVFYNAYKIKKNDKVMVDRADGTVATFAVDAMEQINKSMFPTRRVYGRVGYAGLRLITCGGKFNKDRRHFSDNVIVYAHLTPRAGTAGKPVRSTPHPPRPAGR
ncbi:class F sortase [Actinocorallia longicatena]|uniref:Sortase family protein n=1 Tax=Actinocorallia longicatena TaxID=111803 RepID=A0ABP6PY51_9ACTN